MYSITSQILDEDWLHLCHCARPWRYVCKGMNRISLPMGFIVYWKKKYPLSEELQYQCQAQVFLFVV